MNDDYVKEHQFTNDLEFENFRKISPNLTCVPMSFGYDIREFDLLFPYTRFGSCKNEFADAVFVNKSSNTLVLNCDSKNSLYFLGNDRKEELLGFDIFNDPPTSYQGPVDLKGKEIEWAYGSCNQKVINIESAFYQHIPDPDLIKRVSETMKRMQSEFTHPSNKTTPLTVIMLSLDSVSRSRFYKRLPITLNFLKSLNPKKFKINDFLIHNVIGDSSIPNVYSILTGRPLEKISSHEKLEILANEVDMIEEFSIWKYFSSTGWATLFGTEFCDNYFAHTIGRKPKVDHILSRFWCAAEKLSGFEDKKQEQRCIGGYDSHFYMLNYTLQYVQNYQGINKWGHVMLLPGHEDSGKVISTLDQDLKDFLAQLLKTKDHIIVFLMGDHGPRFGNWRKTLDGAQEHKLPMLFTIVSTKLLEKIPFSFDILDHNSFRLVSKFDIFKTLRHISYLPYHRTFNKNGYYHTTWGAGLHRAYSLLIEKITDERTCEDAFISREFCACDEFKNFHIHEQKESVKNFIWNLVDEIIDQINEETQTNFYNYGKKYCEKVSLNRILKTDWIKINNFDQKYRIRFRVNEDKNAVFEAVVQVWSYKFKSRKRLFNYPVKGIIFQGKVNFRVNYIKKESIGNEMCDNFIYSLGIVPQICICKKETLNNI